MCPILEQCLAHSSYSVYISVNCYPVFMGCVEMGTHTTVRMKLIKLLIMSVLVKLDPAIPLGIFPIEMPIVGHGDMCKKMFIIVLFIVVENETTSQC